MTFSALDSELLGPLFATKAMRDNFSDTAMLATMLRAEEALARAQARFGLAPDGLATAIAAAGEGLDAVALGRATALAGVPTIPFVKAVQSALSPDIAGAFHKAATTQDIMDTALVLRLRSALELIETDLRAVISGLMRLAVEHRQTACVGRTYAQHAAPVTFGFKAAVWLTGITDALDQLGDLRKRVLVASLAGPVGTLAGLGTKGPAVLEAYAEELSLGSTPLAWHALRGRIAETGCWVAGLIGAIAKMATDMLSLSSTEVGEVSEPHVPGRGGSSAMPHKRNPVSSTVILSAHASAPALAASLLQGMAAAHERPAGAWHAEWHALPTLFGLASGALREARGLSEGMVVDKDRMLANIGLTRGMLFADAAASRLIPLLGREAAHDRVEHASEEVRRLGTPLQDVLSRDPQLASPVASAFDLTPAIAAAGAWVDRAVEHAGEVLGR